MKLRTGTYISILVFSALIFIGLAGCTQNERPLPTLVSTVASNAELQITPATTPEAVSTAELETNSTGVIESTEVTESGDLTPVPSAESSSDTNAEPTRTSAPKETAVPTITPTSLPQLDPSLEITGPEAGDDVSVTAVPTPVPTFEVPDNTTNVLLLGNDGGTNTDSIMIVSVNRTGPTASIISIPRDLYLYQPGRRMDRVNTAVARGGVELLKQTILYNFGIPIHYYARINFDGFQEIVDIMDGVELPVSCQLADWRIKSPELDPENEDNWEIFTLPPGVHEMDGETALWYARSRQSTSDFDRGRRQQQLLHAMFNQGVDLGLITQFPQLWNTYQDFVETDMDIGRMLQLAALAPEIRANGIQHLYLTYQLQPWTTPGGAHVQLPRWEGERLMKETFSRLYLPPALNHADQPPIEVEIINATDDPDLLLLAASNLAWHGFIPIMGESEPDADAVTHLDYYRPNFKGSYDWLISWVFDLRQSQIELVDDSAFEYDYRVVIGDDYDPCRPQMNAPQIFLDQ